MPKTIVVPLDGSHRAARALECAKPLAARLDADIVVVASTWASSEDEVRPDIEEQLATHGLPDVEVRLPYLYPPEAIAAAVADVPDPLVCMTSHGRSGLGHAVLGSVAEEVLGSTDIPVLLVGPDADLGPRHGGLVLCLDATPASAEIVPVATAWATILGLDVDVVTVHPSDDRPMSRFSCADREQLHAAVVQLEQAHLVARDYVVNEIGAARGLAAFAEHHQSAFIAATTRARAGLARDVLGSTTANLVRLSPCPLLLVRSPRA